jgi:hypothetical protein
MWNNVAAVMERDAAGVVNVGGRGRARGAAPKSVADGDNVAAVVDGGAAAELAACRNGVAMVASAGDGNEPGAVAKRNGAAVELAACRDGVAVAASAGNGNEPGAVALEET